MDESIENSVLKSVKSMIGISQEDSSFDVDIIMYINATLFTLYQLGVIPKIVQVTSDTDSFEDLVGGYIQEIGMFRLYIAQKVRVDFDPSSSSTVLQSLKDSIKEMEWRMLVSAEFDRKEEESDYG